MKKIFLGLGIFLVILAVIPSMLSDEFELSRSIKIKAPADKVFSQVNDLKNWENWSPWLQHDNTIKITYADVTEGVRASYSWTSQDSGEGTLTIVESVPNEMIKTIVDFKEQGSAEGHWKFEPSGDDVKVTWGFYYKVDHYFGRYFNLVMGFFLKASYDKGLNNIKKIAEG